MAIPLATHFLTQTLTGLHVPARLRYEHNPNFVSFT